MKTSFYTFLKQLTVVLLLAVSSLTVSAQKDSIQDILKRAPAVVTDSTLNMDAIYNRPFLTVAKTPVAVGGYLKANSFYSSEDGLSEGLSFQARRLTVFMSSSIGKRLNFLTEIEFEEGGKEIAIEFAARDLAINPAFNFRGGIIMNSIGAFNQNHDGPKWEFIERPDVGVNLLPVTWSNAGFGIFGKMHKGNWVFGYELYATNGFDGGIIDNEDNRTSLAATKDNEERFEESSNGQPMFTGKIAIKNRKVGEIGLSYMGGYLQCFHA